MTAVLLAVGTDKGLFLGTSNDRTSWSWTGPHAVMAHAVMASDHAGVEQPGCMFDHRLE